MINQHYLYFIKVIKFYVDILTTRLYLEFIILIKKNKQGGRLMRKKKSKKEKFLSELVYPVVAIGGMFQLGIWYFLTKLSEM